jgi:hypothetical protein
MLTTAGPTFLTAFITADSDSVEGSDGIAAEGVPAVNCGDTCQPSVNWMSFFDGETSEVPITAPQNAAIKHITTSRPLLFKSYHLYRNYTVHEVVYIRIVSPIVELIVEEFETSGFFIEILLS